MKQLLPLVFALAGCSKSSTPDPTPAPQLAGTWSLTAARTVTTPKNGGAATTTNQSVTPGETKVTYATDGTYLEINNGRTGQIGTYTYSGSTLVVTANGQSVTGTTTELTANRLVLAINEEDAITRSAITKTFSR